MFEICMIVGISLGFLYNVEQKVYTLDCDKEIYTAIEIKDELIEVKVIDDKIEIKNDTM